MNQIRTCPVCSTKYDHDPVRLAKHGRGLTCSKKCSYIIRSGPRKQVTATCPICQKSFSRTQSTLKKVAANRFCSSKCHYQGRSIGISPRPSGLHYKSNDTPQTRANRKAGAAKAVATRRRTDKYVISDETRERIRHATIRQMKSRSLITSKAEDDVAKTLTTLGVRFSRWRKIRNEQGRFVGIIDFWLTDIETALEFNGTFWHSDPRVFPNGPVFDAQIRSAKQWSNKTKHLDKMGIPLLVLWEKDFRLDAVQSIKDLLNI